MFIVYSDMFRFTNYKESIHKFMFFLRIVITI